MSLLEGASLEIFHIGNIVDDLEASMARYGAALGLEWAPPKSVRVPFLTDVGLVHVDSVVTYSTAPPVHIELAQAVGDLYTPAGGPRMHHIGAWTADVLATSARLIEQGFPLHAAIEATGGDSPSYVFHKDPGGGLFIELCDEANRESVCAWLGGE
jgi:Glyoxalase/Bleomycin resistance protein/Dioxygenase superfamily